MISSQDFIDLVNQKTKSNYSWFFDQYLYKNEVPELSYKISHDGQLIFRWNNVLDNFNKLKIHLISNGKTIQLTPSNKIRNTLLQADKDGMYSITF